MIEPHIQRTAIPHSKPLVTAGDAAAVQAALTSGQLAEGAIVRAFEQELAAYLGAGETACCGSGSAALALILRGAGIGAGDEVIVPTYVCASVQQVVAAAGATAVLCDIGPDWLMEPAHVLKCLTPASRAVVVVHTFGLQADSAAIARLGVPVIEDCCQAFAPGFRSPESIASFCSFHATKCLCTGEGGVVVARDAALLRRVRALRDERMVTAPMSDLQAALGRSQLSRYPQMLARRRHLAARYRAELPLCGPPARQPVPFRYPIRATRGGFEATRQAFLRSAIHVRRGVDTLLHRLGGRPDRDFTGAVELFEETVSLPLYPALTDEEQGRVIAAARSIWHL